MLHGAEVIGAKVYKPVSKVEPLIESMIPEAFPAGPLIASIQGRVLLYSAGVPKMGPDHHALDLQAHGDQPGLATEPS